MRYTKSDIVLGGYGPLPLGTYTVRCLEAKKSETNAGKPCLKAKWEIIAPSEVEVAGKKYTIAGRKFDTMPNLLDPSVSYGMGSISEALERGQFDMTKFNPEGEIDDDAFFVLQGWTVDMELHTEESFKTRPPTPEEVAAGADLKTRVDIVDGAGDKVSQGHYVRARMQDIVGPGSVGF